jgi:hypothetical protein
MQIAVIEKITDFDLSHVARLVNRRKFAQLLVVVDEGRGCTSLPRAGELPAIAGSTDAAGSANGGYSRPNRMIYTATSIIYEFAALFGVAHQWFPSGRLAQRAEKFASNSAGGR